MARSKRVNKNRLPVPPTPKKQPWGPSLIYFLQCCEAIKIGTTGDLTRVAILQVGTPHRLKILGTIFGAHGEEGLLHQRFGKARIIGEWFDKQILPDVVALLQDPMQLLRSSKTRQPLVGTPKEVEKRRCLQCSQIYEKYGRGRGYQCVCPHCGTNWTETENIYLPSADQPKT